jgi:hypothetical protein
MDWRQFAALRFADGFKTDAALGSQTPLPEALFSLGTVTTGRTQHNISRLFEITSPLQLGIKETEF